MTPCVASWTKSPSLFTPSATPYTPRTRFSAAVTSDRVAQVLDLGPTPAKRHLLRSAQPEGTMDSEYAGPSAEPAGDASLAEREEKDGGNKFSILITSPGSAGEPCLLPQQTEAELDLQPLTSLLSSISLRSRNHTGKRGKGAKNISARKADMLRRWQLTNINSIYRLYPRLQTLDREQQHLILFGADRISP